MKYPTAVHLISGILKRNNIPAVLIGGFAVRKYCTERQTVDIDFMIKEEDYEKILVELNGEGYYEHEHNDTFAKVRTNSNYLIDMDFMFVDAETFDKIIKDGEKSELSGQIFIVPSLRNLIALKLHAIKNNMKVREFKDIPDIINMIRQNNMDINSDELKELCLKYGTKEIYDKILKISR